MSETETMTWTMTDAMARLQRREVSAVELLQTAVQRIRDTETTLHSWVEVYEQEALAQAVVADRRRAHSASPPPLLGIPVAIKDIFDIAGKPTRCNSTLRDTCEVAARDSAPVHALRRAGAIMLGKTVTQEFAAGVISTPARNPWNPERIPGGSSGGSAASVAADTSLGALGSDTGGSIRIPASVTGTVGLKPTYGRLGMKGTFPLSPSLDTVGPIAGTVAGAAALYLALAHRTQEIGETVTRLDEAAGAPSLKGKRIGVLASYFNERLQPDVSAAFVEAVEKIRALGAEIVECDWHNARAAASAAMLISRVESAAVHYDALRGQGDSIGDDVRLRFEVGALLPSDVYLHARQARQAVTRSIAAVYSDNHLDAIVAPTLVATAPPVEQPLVTYADGSEEAVGSALTRLTMPWNATGQPVITVPCGFDREHLPIGLSFVGRPDQELDLCSIAHAYEQSAGWFHERPPL